MPISRAKKEELVQEYVDHLQRSQAIIITDFRGLTVNELHALRSKIREAQGGYKVVKNTLAIRALREAGLPVDEELLTGPIAFGFCYDEVPGVAKALTDFAKDYEVFEIKGGLLGDQKLTPQSIKDLAALPPLDVIRAQLLGLLQAPASQLAGVVAGGVRQVVNVVNAYAEQGQDSEEDIANQ
ncbi:MAG: 50S ribosomal protein L10 [Anaerolineae bacterium]